MAVNTATQINPILIHSVIYLAYTGIMNIKLALAVAAFLALGACGTAPEEPWVCSLSCDDNPPPTEKWSFMRQGILGAENNDACDDPETLDLAYEELTAIWYNDNAALPVIASIYDCLVQYDASLSQ
jgi:hypothetical protein